MDLSINIDMGLIFFVLLPVLGAALVVGGVIAYRVSKTGMAKAFSAASIVSGIAMWLVLASVTITSSSGTAPAPTIVTAVKSDEALGLSEQTFLHLLLAEDVQPMLSEEALLTTSYENLREIEGNKNPENVANINSWFGLTIENDGSPDPISFALMDFDSSTAASAYFEKTRISKKAIPEVEAAYGRYSQIWCMSRV